MKTWFINVSGDRTGNKVPVPSFNLMAFAHKVECFHSLVKQNLRYLRKNTIALTDDSLLRNVAFIVPFNVGLLYLHKKYWGLITMCYMRRKYLYCRFRLLRPHDLIRLIGLLVIFNGHSLLEQTGKGHTTSTLNKYLTIVKSTKTTLIPTRTQLPSPCP